MVEKVLTLLRRYDMVRPGEKVVCAVSGGADSVALLWCLYLEREKLGITLEAAHFNHQLRGAESDRDEQFVRELCGFYDIPVHIGRGQVVPGKKGLEAAARESRYAWLASLGGTIATAHTADDNAETVLMHLVRGTGLRGLGGITPKSEGVIRPMLDVTREEVEAFLAEHWVRHIEDSSNGTDDFLRNRLRHHIMPRLKQENPSLASALSAMAQRLRRDEELLASLAREVDATDVAALRAAPEPLRRRALEGLLQAGGFPEPGASHITGAEELVFAARPSAYRVFPGGVILRREYDRLVLGREEKPLEPVELHPGEGKVLSNGMEVFCDWAQEPEDGPDRFTVWPQGAITIRPRAAGDTLTRPGGTKSLKKRLIDGKIPAARRDQIPVVCDEKGVLGVYGFGANLARAREGTPVRICFVTSGRKAGVSLEKDLEESNHA